MAKPAVVTKATHPRWFKPKLKDYDPGDPARYEDPEGWEWRRRSEIAWGAMEHWIRHGPPAVSALCAREWLDRTDPKPRVGADDGAAQRPVAVQIVVNAAGVDASGGVVLRLGSGVGDGAAG